MTARRLLVGVALLVVAAVAFIVVWFEPQALFIDDKVDEDVPVAASASAEGSAHAASPARLSEGEVMGVDGHSMKGTAVILEAGGKRYLRFEDLSGDNGPDLVVYLSSAPADGDPDDLDDDVVTLGGLKGNVGSSNYELPPDVDLDRYRTAVVWCRRFSVGFAAAALA